MLLPTCALVAIEMRQELENAMTYVNQQTTLHDIKLRSGMLFFVDNTELQTNFCGDAWSHSRRDTMRVASCILALEVKLHSPSAKLRLA